MRARLGNYLSGGGKGIRTSVLLRGALLSNSLINWRRVRHTRPKLYDRRNDQVLDPARLKQGNGANEAGFGGALHKKCWKQGRAHLGCRRGRAWRLAEKRRNTVRLRYGNVPIRSHWRTIQFLHQRYRCHETRTNPPTVWSQ